MMPAPEGSMLVIAAEAFAIYGVRARFAAGVERLRR